MNVQYVLARIFGTNDALFSRDDEQRIFRQVAEVGLGPKLLVSPETEATPCSLCSTIRWKDSATCSRYWCTSTSGTAPLSFSQELPHAQANFRNGRVEEFLQDQAISAADMQSGPIAFCVATAMAHFHFSPLILSRNGVTPQPILWKRTRAWARAVQQHYSAAELKALGLQNVLQEVCTCALNHRYMKL